MKLIKKIAIISLIILSMFTLVSFLGCTQQDNNEDMDIVTQLPQVPPKDFSLDRYKIDMIIGEQTQLKAIYTVEENKQISYVSENNEIVSVEQNGLLTAVNIGKTNITVTYGTQTKVCEVSVGFGVQVPILNLKELSGDDITVCSGDVLNLDTEVMFNGVAYRDAVIEYSYTGIEGLGTFDEQAKTFKTSQEKRGEGKITILASWRGLDASTIATLRKEITVKVITNVFIQSNLTEYILYTTESFNGESYDTELPFEIKVYENNQLKENFDISFLSGEDVVVVEGNKIKALKYGTAEINIEYTDTFGEERTLLIPVEVKRPLKVYETKLDFSSMDGTLPLQTLFEEDVTLIEAYQDDRTTPLTISEDGKKIFGLTMHRDRVTESTLMLYTEKLACQVSINGYAKLIKTQEDLQVFNLLDNDNNKKTTNQNAVIDGYFMVANDITNDSTIDNSNRHPGMKYTGTGNLEEPVLLSKGDKIGFQGVFDGQGHTLAVDVYQGGIFGVLQKKAIIKNAKFDVTFTNTNLTAAAVLAYDFATDANPNNDTTAIQFSDLYIHIADFRTALNSSKTAGLVYKGRQGFVFNNVIIEIDNHKLVSTKDKYDGLPYIGDTEMNAESDWNGFVNANYTNNTTLGNYSTYDEYIKAYRGEFGKNERDEFIKANTIVSGAIFAIHDDAGAGLDWYYRGLYVISKGAIMAAMTDTWNRNLTFPDGWFLCSYVVFGDDATLVSGTDYVLNENFDNQGNTFTGDKATAKGHACLQNYVLKRPRRYNSKAALKDANNGKIGHWVITEDSIVWAN